MTENEIKIKTAVSILSGTSQTYSVHKHNIADLLHSSMLELPVMFMYKLTSMPDYDYDEVRTTKPMTIYKAYYGRGQSGSRLTEK